METNYKPDHKTALDDILLHMPGVKGGKAFGYPAYKVNGKMFAFVGGEGVSIKLTEARVNELVGTNPHFHPFSPAEGTIWKAWLSIDPASPADYAQYEALFHESVLLVAEN